MLRAGSRSCLASILAIGLASGAFGSDQYGPPSGYYSSVVFDGTPASLRSSLNDIIDGHTIRSYGAARQALAILDADPANPENVILIYNGASVDGSWDSGVTWNREHMWPRSLGVGDNGADYSDLHALRPCHPSINSSRGNKPFGLDSSSYWDPTMASSPYDFRGEAARAIFYMDVRYDGTDAATSDLTVIDGFPSVGQMGDLSYLLDWHYEEEPSTRERRRNHLVFSFDDNPFYAQGNRNPFVDHPEFAWALWGEQPNDSQIVFAEGSVSGDGSSELTLNIGRFILSPALEDAMGQTVSVQKSGSTPTSFLVEATGDAYSADHAMPRTFARGEQSADIDVAIWAPSPGPISGQLVIDNTDLTSAGGGFGSADGNDTLTISGTGVTEAVASFAPSAGQTSLAVDLGVLERSLDTADSVAAIFNAGGLPETTADLVITTVEATGSSQIISVPVLDGTSIEGNQFVLVEITGDRSGPLGVYEVQYTFETADEPIPGAGLAETLTLSVSMELIPSSCPGDLNASGGVDLSDLNAVLANFGLASGATLDQGDASGDGSVGLADLNIVLAGFGTACP